ncbi:uncharacterized protein LOC104908700 isoform X2 [Beta vulgaris subsp. vulgaris]|uniref:uncharacterized protein LOC104908700 isoform X2 n=1 Tax=Beta vulgaris subsp. vulgaris TaxID=3555 RepID=UPI0020370C7C|nr:uncharacterized protein LOC104908700 isoform X2 [Beta vulgaris subsp. vulgaris]
MTLLLHSGGSSSSNSYISQTVRSFDSNRRIHLYHHHHYSHSLSSSSIWKLTNVNGNGSAWNCQAISSIGMLAAAVVLSTPPPSEETMSNIPLELSGKSCDPMDKECIEENTKKRIQRPKSRSAESCTTKCVGTCIRGGDGSPGEGPLNVRRPIIVFKQGFRSRQYCLVECSDICNLLDDADKRR